jgi:hypothetical protein
LLICAIGYPMKAVMAEVNPDASHHQTTPEFVEVRV